MNKIFLKTIAFSLGLFVSGMGPNFAHAMAPRPPDSPAKIVAQLQKQNDPLQPHETVYVAGWRDWFLPPTYYTAVHVLCNDGRCRNFKVQDSGPRPRQDYWPKFLRTVISVSQNGMVTLPPHEGEHFQKENIHVSIGDIARTRPGTCLPGTNYCIGQWLPHIGGADGNLPGTIVGVGLGNLTLDGMPWVMVKFTDGTIHPCVFAHGEIEYYGN